MDVSKMLSGEQLVMKGVTKIDAALPELGMKDVLPKGSWLEQKQIQSALEARKHLVEVERIEKSGTLSHAEWRDDLKLAEVTQQTGGYWQYLGQHIEKKLYLKPEEALFLMEINSLLLKHNEVTVSLQKAYSLLLSDTISILQYKVYTSLSRLGYKVYTHKELEIDKIKNESLNNESNDFCNKSIENRDISESKINKDNEIKLDLQINDPNSLENKEIKSDSETNDEKLPQNTNSSVKEISNEDFTLYKEQLEDDQVNKIISMDVEKFLTDNVDLNHKDIDSKTILNNLPNITEAEFETHILSSREDENKMNDVYLIDETIMNVDSEVSCNVSEQKHEDNCVEISEISESVTETNPNNKAEYDTINSGIYLQTLLKRKIKPADTQNIHNALDDIPDLFKKNTVIINVPKDEYIPKNIFVNNTSYVLDLDKIKTKYVESTSNEQNYNALDEANESLRRINNTRNDMSQYNSSHLLFTNIRYPRMNHQYRPYNFWRPRNNLNYFQFNMFCQRPLLQNYFMQRFNFSPRMNHFLRQLPNSGYFNNFGLTLKRTRDEKQYHLEHIKILTSKLKQGLLIGNRNVFNVQTLQRLIFSYNTKFRCRLRLADDFEVVDDSTVFETIELEDEGESKRKKPKFEMDKFKDNLNKIRKMALRLKNMEGQGIASSRLKRAFSNIIRTFNKSFNADIYINEKYEIIDRKHITLDSSSDSDCVIEKNEGNRTKKLRNPFSILKAFTKTINNEQPSTSNIDNTMPQNQNEQKSKDYQVFENNWLPNPEDFGCMEVVAKQNNSRITDTFKDDILYDFLRNNPNSYENWLEAKINFGKYIESTTKQLEYSNNAIENDGGLRPIIGPNDCKDMPSILNKLRIIAIDNGNRSETRLKINFDVYNRDVQNFRKSNRPKPHFRVICIDESSNFPSGEELLGLQSNYKDGVPIVFAIVSISSISYLQINPTDLPMYIPSSDLA